MPVDNAIATVNLDLVSLQFHVDIKLLLKLLARHHIGSISFAFNLLCL